MKPGTHPDGIEFTDRPVNDSGNKLVYLRVSTMREQDVMVYPDTGNSGTFVNTVPGDDRSARTLSRRGSRNCRADYRDGEH